MTVTRGLSYASVVDIVVDLFPSSRAVVTALNRDRSFGVESGQTTETDLHGRLAENTKLVSQETVSRPLILETLSWLETVGGVGTCSPCTGVPRSSIVS